MNIQWQSLILKIIFWLAAEVALTLVGLDEIADFSEFLASSKDLTRDERLVRGSQARL